MSCQALDRDGGQGLFEHLESQDRRAGTHTFLLDSTGADLGGHVPPAEVAALAHEARARNSLQVASTSEKAMVAMPIEGKDGMGLVFAREMLHNSERFRGPVPLRDGGKSELRGADRGAKMPPMTGPPMGGPGAKPPDESPIERIVSEPMALAAILAAVITSSGLVCFMLARHIARPVQNLRSAARRMADGEWTTRVQGTTTRRKDEIGELAHDFDFMAERIETLVMGQKRLHQDISHELRSPLARLNVALELARNAAGESARPALARVEREAQRLNELMSQLLTLSRLEGSDPPTFARVELHQLVDEVAADAEFEAKAANRHVQVIHRDEVDLSGSPELLKRALENVVRNAVAYTEPGTAVEISLRKCMERGSQWAVIAIRDHGPGVPSESLERIFDPFFRLAASNETSNRGSGLGLSIARRAIQSHGGAVRAVNCAEGGLMIEIRLPREGVMKLPCGAA